MLNNWTTEVVKRLEEKWSWHMDHECLNNNAFKLASPLGYSFLDIGCGYGRFYEYLLSEDRPFHYIGYDSSDAMITKACVKHSVIGHKFFSHDIFEPFKHDADVILCNDVFIHLTLQNQVRVLRNINMCRFNASVVSIQVTEDEPKIRTIHLKEQPFLDVVQYEEVFLQTLFDEITCVDSISVDKVHVVNDVFSAVFVVRRNLAI